MTIGPQRSPSSLSKIKAETKQVQQQLGESLHDRYYRLKSEVAEARKAREDCFTRVRGSVSIAEDVWTVPEFYEAFDRWNKLSDELILAKRDLQRLLNEPPSWSVSTGIQARIDDVGFADSVVFSRDGSSDYSSVRHS